MKPPSVDGVLDALYAQPAKSVGAGRCVMFIAARRGEGVTTVARAAAQGADNATTYTIDLDLRRNALGKSFAEEGVTLGPRTDGRLGGHSFYQLVDADGRQVHEMSSAFSYHRVGRSRIYVGAFDGRAIPEGGQLMISKEPAYWNAARAGGALVVVDAPALEHSHLGLRVAPHMDGVVLVVSGEDGAAPAALAACNELAAAGAEVTGVVYTRANGAAMLADRLMRRAG